MIQKGFDTVVVVVVLQLIAVLLCTKSICRGHACVMTESVMRLPRICPVRDTFMKSNS